LARLLRPEELPALLPLPFVAWPLATILGLELLVAESTSAAQVQARLEALALTPAESLARGPVLRAEGGLVQGE